ncbi:MAG: four helix bundle protein [Planctomycetota bacterium]|nr:four helix bundle protein [Planctomycetota bacterium]
MNEQLERNYDLQDRLIDFVVRVLNVVESLPNTKAGNHIAGQLVRSGSSPAPNYGEAQSAESRKDFIHKMKIALKELRETLVWLLVIQRKPLIAPTEKLDPIIQENNELIAIFVASITTAKDNLNNESQS